jgi:hypothetical protein
MNEATLSLEDTIAMLAAHARHQGVTLTRTKLVKLLYLLDVRAWETIGRTLTGVEWIWHHYGPYSPTVVEVCKRMSSTGELEAEETSNFFGSPEYRVRSANEAYYRDHSPVFMALARQIIAEFGRFAPSMIGDLTYETEPMRRIVREGQRGDLIEFEDEPRNATDVRRTAQRYAALARKTRGRDEGDIADGLREQELVLQASRASAMARMFGDEQH